MKVSTISFRKKFMRKQRNCTIGNLGIAIDNDCLDSEGSKSFDLD